MGRDRCLCPFEGCSKSFGRYERLQRHLLTCHAATSCHREIVPPKSNPSGRKTNGKSAHSSSHDVLIDGTAQAGSSSMTAPKRRKRQRITKKLPSETRTPSEGPIPASPQEHVPLVIDLRTPSPPPSLMCITDLHDTPASTPTQHPTTPRSLSRVPTWVTSPASASRQPPAAEDHIDELDSDNDDKEHKLVYALEAPQFQLREKPAAGTRSGVAESPFERLGGMCRRRPISDPPVEPQQVSSASQDASRRTRQQSFPLSDDSDEGVMISQPGHIGSRGWQCPPAFEPFVRYAFDTPPPGGFASVKAMSEATDVTDDRGDRNSWAASISATTPLEVVGETRQSRVVDGAEARLADNQGGGKDISITQDLGHAADPELGERRSVALQTSLAHLEGERLILQDASSKSCNSDSPVGSSAGPSTPISRTFGTTSEMGTPLSASIVEHILGDSKAHDHPRSPSRVGNLHSDVILETASSIFLAIGGALGELVRARRSACQCDQSGLRSSQEVVCRSSNPPDTPSAAKRHHLKLLRVGCERRAGHSV